MTNFEKYFDDLTTTSFGLLDGKPIACRIESCGKCGFDSTKGCSTDKMEWLKAEYEEPKKINIPVNTPIDTKVLVSETGAKWYRRYYAGYENGNHYVWANGANSWSVNKEDKGHKTSWKYIKFAEEE